MGDISDEVLKKVFDDFDKDKSGMIERGEIKAALMATGLPEDTAQGIANNCFEDADFNQDGKISFEEFKKGVAKK